jgi:hypothetical protein
LIINGAYDSQITLNQGSKLGGSGNFTADMTIRDGGNLSPGNSPGLMTTSADLDLLTGSTFTFELVADTTAGRGANFDGVGITGLGGLTIQTGVAVDLLFDDALSSVDFTSAFWDSNQSWLVFDNANTPNLDSLAIFDSLNISNDSNAVNFSATGGELSFRQDGNDIYLDFAAIPEPSTWLLMMGSLSALWFFRSRCSRK